MYYFLYFCFFLCVSNSIKLIVISGVTVLQTFKKIILEQ